MLFDLLCVEVESLFDSVLLRVNHHSFWLVTPVQLYFSSDHDVNEVGLVSLVEQDFVPAESLLSVKWEDLLQLILSVVRKDGHVLEEVCFDRLLLHLNLPQHFVVVLPAQSSYLYVCKGFHISSSGLLVQ